MTVTDQAAIISRYLIGNMPSDKQLELYERALSHEQETANRRFDKALSRPRLLPYIDAYDAFFRPDSLLRRRSYLLFSILEAAPDFSADFLPVKRSPWYLFVVGAIGLRAIFRLTLGIAIVKLGSF